MDDLSSPSANNDGQGFFSATQQAPALNALSTSGRRAGDPDIRKSSPSDAVELRRHDTPKFDDDAKMEMTEEADEKAVLHDEPVGKGAVDQANIDNRGQN